MRAPAAPAIRTKVEFSEGSRACRRRQGCQLQGAATSVRRRFGAALWTVQYLPLCEKMVMREIKHKVRQGINSRLGMAGTIEGAWMMTVEVDPVGDSAESGAGSTITNRVLVEVRPFWSVATY